MKPPKAPAVKTGSGKRGHLARYAFSRTPSVHDVNGSTSEVTQVKQRSSYERTFYPASPDAAPESTTGSGNTPETDVLTREGVLVTPDGAACYDRPCYTAQSQWIDPDFWKQAGEESGLPAQTGELRPGEAVESNRPPEPASGTAPVARHRKGDEPGNRKKRFGRVRDDEDRLHDWVVGILDAIDDELPPSEWGKVAEDAVGRADRREKKQHNGRRSVELAPEPSAGPEDRDTVTAELLRRVSIAAEEMDRVPVKSRRAIRNHYVYGDSLRGAGAADGIPAGTILQHNHRLKGRVNKRLAAETEPVGTEENCN